MLVLVLVPLLILALMLVRVRILIHQDTDAYTKLSADAILGASTDAYFWCLLFSSAHTDAYTGADAIACFADA